MGSPNIMGSDYESNISGLVSSLLCENNATNGFLTSFTSLNIIKDIIQSR